MPYDQVVKFPSRSCRVTFDANVASSELQDVRVQGVLIWKVTDAKKAYNVYSTDLCNEVPNATNDKLAEGLTAVVRDEIAKLTIDEIMKKRDVIREQIRQEFQTTLKGNGIKVQATEITDVYIINTQLFKDMQQKHRDLKRSKAQVYRMQIDEKLSKLKNKVAVDLKVVTDASNMRM